MVPQQECAIVDLGLHREQEFGFWEVVPAQQSRSNSLDGRRAMSSSSIGGSADASAADTPSPAQSIHLGAGDRSRSASRSSLASSEGATAAAHADAGKDAEGLPGGVHRESSSDQLVPQSGGAPGLPPQQQQQKQKRGWWFGGGGGKSGAAQRLERKSWAARPLLPAPFSQTRAKDDNLRLAVTICERSDAAC